jgi:hypothetical protein
MERFPLNRSRWVDHHPRSLAAGFRAGGGQGGWVRTATSDRFSLRIHSGVLRTDLLDDVILHPDLNAAA